MSWVKDGLVATFTMDRPEARNARDLATIEQLLQALAAHAADPARRVVVLTGAGSRAFCAGADLPGLAASPELRRHAGRQYAALLACNHPYPRPVLRVSPTALRIERAPHWQDR